MRLSKNNSFPSEAPNRSGFTLVEVMVTVVIVGILALLAYPSYRETVTKARRAEAKAALLQLMQQQERYYSQANTYIAFSADSINADARRFKWFSGDSAKTSAYELAGKACDGESIRNCIKLIAMPGTAKVNTSFADPDCGELTLTSTGVKSAKGISRHCW